MKFINTLNPWQCVGPAPVYHRHFNETYWARVMLIRGTWHWMLMEGEEEGREIVYGKSTTFEAAKKEAEGAFQLQKSLDAIDSKATVKRRI